MVPDIGFMQGRLSPIVNGKIQAFPWGYWRDEFPLAAKHGFPLMEWTLDQERLYENPLMTREGRKEIGHLSEEYGVAIRTLTGDCFMQAPFYKATGKIRDQLLADARKVVENCAILGIQSVLLPLVDNGRLEDKRQEDDLIRELGGMVDILQDTGVQLLFESDYPPDRLTAFIETLDRRYFGITYDIGNSAALGYEPKMEIAVYGHRIRNVHVKDRVQGGGTVPLGKGDANFPAALQALWAAGYQGLYILQTARAADENHAGVLSQYRDMVREWLRDIYRNGS